jgi:hypothetical protein
MGMDFNGRSGLSFAIAQIGLEFVKIIFFDSTISAQHYVSNDAFLSITDVSFLPDLPVVSLQQGCSMRFLRGGTSFRSVRSAKNDDRD